MIVFFGPAGAGKSVQGQILAARHGWRWLSAGQLLRDTHDEILERLRVRGRVDDTPEAIDKRLSIYRGEIYPILDYLNENGVPIIHMSGVGTVGQVHDEIERELVSRGIVEGVK
jgi:adenylate kinase family enzyme